MMSKKLKSLIFIISEIGLLSAMFNIMFDMAKILLPIMLRNCDMLPLVTKIFVTQTSYFVPNILILTFYFLHKLSLETNNLHFRKAFRSLGSCLVDISSILLFVLFFLFKIITFIFLYHMKRFYPHYDSLTVDRIFTMTKNVRQLQKYPGCSDKK